MPVIGMMPTVIPTFANLEKHHRDDSAGDQHPEQATRSSTASPRAAPRGPELAILPFGTGRDTIRTYGIPKRAERALELLRGGRTRTIDLGRATFRTPRPARARAGTSTSARAG